MENKLTMEILEKLKPAKNTEEIIVIAKENGLELTKDAAKKLLEKMAELTDEQLSISAGADAAVSDPLKEIREIFGHSDHIVSAPGKQLLGHKDPNKSSFI